MFLKRVVKRGRKHDAQDEQHVHVERGAELRVVAEEAERDRAEARRRRLDQRLSEEECETDAEQHHGDAERDVVHAPEAAEKPVKRPE